MMHRLSLLQLLHLLLVLVLSSSLSLAAPRMLVPPKAASLAIDHRRAEDDGNTWSTLVRPTQNYALPPLSEVFTRMLTDTALKGIYWEPSTELPLTTASTVSAISQSQKVPLAESMTSAPSHSRISTTTSYYAKSTSFPPHLGPGLAFSPSSATRISHTEHPVPTQPPEIMDIQPARLGQQERNKSGDTHQAPTRKLLILLMGFLSFMVFVGLVFVLSRSERVNKYLCPWTPASHPDDDEKVHLRAEKTAAPPSGYMRAPPIRVTGTRSNAPWKTLSGLVPTFPPTVPKRLQLPLSKGLRQQVKPTRRPPPGRTHVSSRVHHRLKDKVIDITPDFPRSRFSDCSSDLDYLPSVKSSISEGSISARAGNGTAKAMPVLDGVEALRRSGAPLHIVNTPQPPASPESPTIRPLALRRQTVTPLLPADEFFSLPSEKSGLSRAATCHSRRSSAPELGELGRKSSMKSQGSGLERGVSVRSPRPYTDRVVSWSALLS